MGIFFSKQKLHKDDKKMTLQKLKDIDIKAGDILLYNSGGPKLSGPWVHAEIALVDIKNGEFTTGSCIQDGCHFMTMYIDIDEQDFNDGQDSQSSQGKDPDILRVIRFKTPKVARMARNFARSLLLNERKYTNLAKLCYMAAKKCFVDSNKAKPAWTMDKIKRIMKGTDHVRLYCSELVAVVWKMTLSYIDNMEPSKRESIMGHDSREGNIVREAFPIGDVGGCKPFNLNDLLDDRFSKYWEHVGDFLA